MTFSNPSSAASSGLVARVKGILLSPTTEWDKIDGEPETIGGLYTRYVVILSAIPYLASFIHGAVFGYGAFGFSYRPPILGLLIQSVIGYLLGLVMVFVLALVIDALAPTFGGQKDRVQAFKVAAYSGTAGWVASAFGAVPFLGIIGLLGLYSLFLLYRGLPRLMKAPQDQAMGYTAVTVVAVIVLAIIIGVVLFPVRMALGLGAAGGAGMFHHGGQVSGTMHLPGGGTVDMDQLNAAKKQAEIASATIAAQQNGQPPPPGAIKAVAPDALKALLPDSISGYARTEISSESEAAGGMSGSHASGTYTKGDSRIELEVSDIAAAGAIAAMGGAFNVETSRETGSGYEKIGKVDGRMTTEEYDRQSKHGKYSVIVASRFVVQAQGDGVSMDELKGAVSSVGFGKLEGMAH